MPRPPWVDFGLAWASGSTLVAQGRIARALLRWDVFCAERPRGAHEKDLAGQARPGNMAAVFADLERRSLVEHRQGYVYRSTVRGWAVARLVEDAAPSAFVDEDGPTRPRLRLPPEVGTI